MDPKAITQSVNATMLEDGVQAAFAEPDGDHPRRTRALVIVHAGRIVAERYAPGFDAAMPLIGWSMTKMAINALAGILVQDGALRLSDTALSLNGGITETCVARLRSINFCV